MTEKEYFLQHVTFLVDTREKENNEVLNTFRRLGCAYRTETFNTGDYSFEIDGTSYKGVWLGERKGSPAELYGNVMARNKDKDAVERNNLEEECKRALDVKEFIIFLQGVESLAELKNYKDEKATRQGANAGKHIYSTLMAWGCNNRYGVKLVMAKTQKEIAVEIISHAYYFWRNEQKVHYGDNFLKKLLQNACNL